MLLYKIFLEILIGSAVTPSHHLVSEGVHIIIARIRKSYDNFMKDLLNYEQKESFIQNSFHYYLLENDIIEITSKGGLLIISKSDPSKWLIEI